MLSWVKEEKSLTPRQQKEFIVLSCSEVVVCVCFMLIGGSERLVVC